MDPLHLLIADDHPMFRKGMRALLASLPDIEVVEEAASSSEVAGRASLLQPDVILMDLQMPGGGIEATRQVLHASPNVRILVVTMFQDDDSVFAALRAGVRGYILKDADEDEMVRAIRAVGRGEAIFSPAVATRVLAFFAAPHPAVPKEVFPMLTERDPNNAAYHVLRGRLAEAEGHPEEALTAYRRAQVIKPNAQLKTLIENLAVGDN